MKASLPAPACGGDPIVPLESALDLPRRHEEVADLVEEGTVGGPHLFSGGGVVIGVDEARRRVPLGEVVEHPEVVVEERHLARVANRPRAGLGAEDDVRATGIEAAEALDDAQVPEVLVGMYEHVLGHVDSVDPLAGARPIGHKPGDLVAGPRQLVGDPVDDPLEAPSNAVLRLGDGNAHVLSQRRAAGAR